MLKAPFANIEASMPNFKGTVKALRLKDLLYEIVIGNISKTRAPYDPDETWYVKEVAGARATTKLSTKTNL